MAIRICSSISQRGRGDSGDDCIKDMVERLATDLSMYGYKIIDKNGKEVPTCGKFPLTDMKARK